MMIPPMAYFLAEVKRELERQKREELEKLLRIDTKQTINQSIKSTEKRK